MIHKRKDSATNSEESDIIIMIPLQNGLEICAVLYCNFSNPFQRETTLPQGAVSHNAVFHFPAFHEGQVLASIPEMANTH
jgi:hypothetical protein